MDNPVVKRKNPPIDPNRGHRERLREKFRRAGNSGLHDYEMLELLLTFVIPKRDLKPLARILMERFGGLSGVLDASYAALEQVRGLKGRSSSLIKLVKALTEEYLNEKMLERDALSSPQAVINFSRGKLAGQPNEAFLCIYLNTKNEVINHNIVNQGTVDRAAVYPRRIIKEAMEHNAAGLILVHNHPSGHCQPSPEDRALTDSIISVAKTMDIRVLDHIIVGRLGHFSFAERNLI